jgi:hypothetical protein
MDARPRLAALRPLCVGSGARTAGQHHGRLAPAFELAFHFNREARQPNKIVPCKWAGTANKGSGLRGADGVVMACTATLAGRCSPCASLTPCCASPATRAAASRRSTPAVFPVTLPAWLMEAFTAPSDAVYEPFAGAGTTMLAGQRTGRRVLAMELAPAYVDLALERWRRAYPTLPPVRVERGKAASTGENSFP